MDSSLSSVLIALGIGLFVFLAERGSRDKKKSTKAKAQQPRRAPVAVRHPSDVWQPVAREEITVRTAPSAPSPVPLQKKAVPSAPEPVKAPVSRKALQNALIWSEILKTKF